MVRPRAGGGPWSGVLGDGYDRDSRRKRSVRDHERLLSGTLSSRPYLTLTAVDRSWVCQREGDPRRRAPRRAVQAPSRTPDGHRTPGRKSEGCGRIPGSDGGRSGASELIELSDGDCRRSFEVSTTRARRRDTKAGCRAGTGGRREVAGTVRHRGARAVDVTDRRTASGWSARAST